MMRFLLFLQAGALLAASPAFHYADFKAGSDLRLVGASRYAKPALRLTEAKTFLAGAAWHVEKVPISQGFDTTFQFQLTRQGGLGPGADGFAFVIQNSGVKAVAGRGSAGGWGLGQHENRYGSGIPRAIAVFFDTFWNREDGDPSDNYIMLGSNGGPRELRWPPPRLASTPRLKAELKDGAVHTVRILYQKPVLSVYLDNLMAPVLMSAVDLSLVADATGAAWVGFTASTGSGYENHDILNWSFSGTEVSSNMSSVSSNISFVMDTCAPGKNLCTPEHATVEPKSASVFHVTLPGHLEWGASIPNPDRRPIAIQERRGTVCWELRSLGSAGCNGPDGAGTPAGPGFLAPDKPAGSLIMKTEGGRTYFSINDRPGEAFQDNEGYFEFDAEIK